MNHLRNKESNNSHIMAFKGIEWIKRLFKLFFFHWVGFIINAWNKLGFAICCALPVLHPEIMLRIISFHPFLSFNQNQKIKNTTERPQIGKSEQKMAKIKLYISLFVNRNTVKPTHW